MNDSSGVSRGASGLLRVLVDMDGVICDFEAHMLSEFRRLFPKEPYVRPHERRSFYIIDDYERLRPGLGAKLRNIMKSQGFFRCLPPVEGAIDAIQEMMRMPGYVNDSWCTCRPDASYLMLQYEWVKQHLGYNVMQRIILTRDKTMIIGDLLIDDKPVISGIVSPPPWHHVLFTQHQNRHIEKGVDGANFVCRLENWTDRSWRDIIETYRDKTSP